MTRWRQYFARIRGGQPARLERLQQEGKTIELERVDEDDDVIRIALGFGEEFWRVEPDYQIWPLECSVVKGQLIVEQGVPVTNQAKLSFLRKRITRVFYTT
jgi:hypothetical protein